MAAPPELPEPSPLLVELPPQARSAAIYAWQLLRCLHLELDVDESQPVEPPTLDGLSAMLLASSSDTTLVYGGALGSLHRALLRTCLAAETHDLYLMDEETLLLKIAAARPSAD